MTVDWWTVEQECEGSGKMRFSDYCFDCYQIIARTIHERLISHTAITVVEVEYGPVRPALDKSSTIRYNSNPAIGTTDNESLGDE